MDTHERQLLIGAHRGDETSARALWEIHAPRLVMYAQTILRHRADAEDAVQHAMCRVLALPAARVREVREVGAFLASAVRSSALNIVRSARRERRRLDTRRRNTDDTARLHGLTALDAELATAIEALPRRLAEVIVLKHIAGLTFDQLSLALGQNRNTVAARHRAALERLRALLDEPKQTARGAKPVNASGGVSSG